MAGLPSPELFTHSVTIRKATWANVGGVRTPTYADTVLASAVQPMAHGRAQRYDVPASVSAYRLYFMADPAVVVDDLLLWNGRTLSALASSRDEAGQGSVWSLDCKEVS